MSENGVQHNDPALGWRMLVRAGFGVTLPRAVTIVSCAAAGFSPAAAQLAVRETSLGVRPEGMVPHTLEVSAAMRLGYVVETPAGDAVVVDGVRGQLYSDIDTRGRPSIARELRRYFAPQRRPFLTFSPDGTRFASAVKQGERALVVVDGTAGPLFDAVHWDLQPFSPDSRHVAYVATREGSYVAVRDGVVGPAYDAIRSLAFTADSRHIIYTAQRDDREYVVMDGKEVGSGERILGTPTFSVAGNRLAYKVKRGDSTLVVVDGKPGKSYAAVGDRLQFTRDGRVVYLARDSLYYVVVGGVEGRGYPFISEASVRLSENGERVTFGVASAPQGDPFPNAVASPDGRRIASAVGRGAAWFVAMDGVVGPAYEEVRDVTFSRDSRHLVYTAKRADKWMIVVDGAESPVYDEIVGFPPSDRVGGDSFTVLARRGREDFRVTIPWPR